MTVRNTRWNAFLLTTMLSVTSLPAAEKPAIVELVPFPASLTITAARDSQSLLVSGKDAQGLVYDLSSTAKITPAGTQVKLDADGYVVPVEAGVTELLVEAAGLQIKVPVTVQSVDAAPINFVREIGPLLAKVGCNAGTCHGAQKGRGGMKLSLRGYDPLFDYTVLIDDVSGRRYNRSQPDQSLILLKPTQGVPHEGGFLFDENSRTYRMIYDWIREGCQYAETTRVTKIEVFPAEPLLQSETDMQQLIVKAHYDDGSVRDVTRDAVFDTSNFETATVSKTGLVKGVRRGEAAALVRYEGQYAAAPVTVIGERPGYEWRSSPEFNYVDTLVNQKLQRMKLLASDLCTDDEFLRRIKLDLQGIPPSVEQTKAFLADPRDSRTKREAKIDELLASNEFVEHWTLKWSDLLLSSRKHIDEKAVWTFRNWIRSALSTNMPYDEFAREIMTATGSAYENPAANYFRIAREPKILMENMTQVFLGTRFSCNQCHDHPFERWTQTQYYELSAFFANVGRKPGPISGEEIVYNLRAPQQVTHPGTGQPVAATFPFTHADVISADADPREQLAAWLTSKENPYFAKSITNRYFSYFTGRGIIEPVDDIRASNPPSNPELLDALTADFVAHNFDLKYLIRTIAMSHTYQRSYRPNEWNEEDTVNYSHAIPRRLGAESLYDAIMVATGSPTNLPGVPPGYRATQLPDPQIDVSFLDMFGRAPRESPCECERSSEVSLGQTLNLVNGPTVAEAIVHPEGIIARLTAANATPEEFVNEVYLSVICRKPTPEEMAQSVNYLKEVGNPAEGAQDIMWALINSSAFLFNR
ncbi:MAG: DUF1549 domain-containing protein [Planctomycetaceae bacterium]